MANDLSQLVGYRSGRPVFYGTSCDGSTYQLGVLVGYRSGRPVFFTDRCTESGGTITSDRKFISQLVGYRSGRPVFTGGNCCPDGGGGGGSSSRSAASGSASATPSSSGSNSASSGPPPTPSSSSSSLSASQSASASPSSSSGSSGSSGDIRPGGATSSGATSSGSSTISMPGPSSSGSGAGICCNGYADVPTTLNVTVFYPGGSTTTTITYAGSGHWTGTASGICGSSLGIDVYCNLTSLPDGSAGSWLVLYSGCSTGLNAFSSISCSPFALTGIPNLGNCCAPGNIQIVVTS